jgi:hypothetical protein
MSGLPLIRLLNIFERLCGTQLRTGVLEPLVADWQRELAASTSRSDRARILVNGSAAFAWTFVTCLLTGGIMMPRVAIIRGLSVLVASTAALLAIQIGLNTASINRPLPTEMRLWMALPTVLPVAIPMAMLPIMMLIRGTARATSRGAATLIATAAILTYLTAGWLTPLLRGDIRDQLHEEIDRRIAAEERAGRVFYPSTARRQAKPMTAEERAAARERWRRSPIYLEGQAELTRPRWGSSTIMIAALTLAMGALGWALGGLGRTRPLHAAAWWALAWLTMMMEGRWLYPGGTIVAIIGRAPSWMPLAIFSAAAIATLSFLACRRESPGRRTPQPTP